MAAAMARGWAGADERRPEAMAFADAGSGRAAALASEVGGEAVAHVSELPSRSDLLVLAVKRTALDELAGALGRELPPVVSVMAGVPVARLREAFPEAPILRAMPNVAVEVRRGLTCYVPPASEVPEEARRLLIGALELLGSAVPVEEAEIDVATAIMSCSPAYLALVEEALAEAGAREGIDAGLAHELVVETMAGTAELLRARAPEEVRSAVASPGGATEAGLEALERRDLGAAVEEAVAVSLERMRE